MRRAPYYLIIPALFAVGWIGHPSQALAQQPETGGSNANIVIVGSGLSGLSAAWEAGCSFCGSGRR